MKTVIKTTIGILAMTFASISVSHADSNRHNRDYDRGHQKQHAKQFDRRDMHKSLYRDQRGNHLRHQVKRPHWKHATLKRHYWKHGRKYVIKQMPHDRAYRRAYGYAHYVAPAYTVRYSGHSHSNKVVPVLAGGLIGSSIANNVSHGDPAATMGGAIFGAIIGNAIARH
ncbi:MAG: hypothetical protein OQK58_12475 [Gammaproteobacteria bacterium]|nr:hypothetical protein [Gammaproteobacteria bacterium]